MELLSKLDPSILSTQKLGQYLLLSLIQQLGVDLAKDTAAKLPWLREAALILDLNDKVIAQHAPGVLAKLLRNLEELYPRFSDHSNPQASNLKLLMHIINSLLK